MAASSMFRCYSGFDLPQCLMAKFFLGCGCLSSNVELWHEASGARAFPCLRLRHAPGWSQETSQPPTRFQFQSALSARFNTKLVFLCSSWAKSKLPTPLPLFPKALLPAKGAHFSLVRPQGWGTQYVASITHSSGSISTHAVSLFILVPSQGTDPELISSLPF